MNTLKRLTGGLGLGLCTILWAGTACGQPSVEVSAGVEIRADSDFYEPLTPYGRWEVVGSYGRCWIPGHVEADWRPYCNGNWQRTDAGWYWASDEPWGWATYHYGRWNLSADFGWYWVPETQWAPAWVSWHSGGGYVGWAPMYPANVRVVSPRGYVFVQESHFTEPIRRTTVVVNNTTIINQAVVREAPATAAIEKASGRKVQAVPVQQLRHQEEAPVMARQQAAVAAGAKKVPTPVRTEVPTAEKKPVAVHQPPQVQKPMAVAHNSAVTAPGVHDPKGENNHAVLAVAEPRPAPAPKPEARIDVKPVPAKESAAQNHNNPPAKQGNSTHPSDKTNPQPAAKTARSSANNENDPGSADKGHEDKGKE